jgi:CRISPR-associated endonuclease/helicase Cas3
MHTQDFPQTFAVLTGNPPFPWQTAMFEHFINGVYHESVSLPTGLGKTSIIAIWLCALAAKPQITPRRLIYVVNRRTVVDQTTAEVERLRESLKEKPELSQLRNTLTELCALSLPDASPLAISTLRGQFADNGEWCADPARPAVVVGTVDMIGSGLLFSRYTRSFKTRPLHAGFLAQDALLVHDEAHLEPCFQSLLETIVATQKASSELRKLCVIALTATHRAGTASSSASFTLTDTDLENETIQKRYHATKRLSLIPLDEKDKLEDRLVSLAQAKPAGRAVLIFTRSVEVALKVAAELNKGEHRDSVAVLTGTMRGAERDALVERNPVFQRFLPKNDRTKSVEPTTGTVFLVATSAGEVGVNLSADDLVCDLSTYESMAQRFGRVNRFGLRDDSEITVVHEKEFKTAEPLEAARERTLALLQKLDRSASPASLDTLPAEDRAAAFSPPPSLRVATDVQFDAWALTSIREPIAARPPVAPYLHGESEWQPPETHLAWRNDQDFIHIAADAIEGFLDTFPLHPRELLRDTTDRIFNTLVKLVTARLEMEDPLPSAWLIDEFGSVQTLSLAPFALAAKPKREQSEEQKAELDRLKQKIAKATLLLPASLGGLDSMGLFSASAKTPASDCSGIERRESDAPDNTADFSLIISDEDAEEARYLHWFAPLSEPTAKRRSLTAAETLEAHTRAVRANAAAIAAKLFPETPVPNKPDLAQCLVVAASLHDLGKNRAPWQRNIGNLAYDRTNPATIFAKSGGKMRPRNVAEYYRHEFGSLLDAEHTADFHNLTEIEQEIALHLVAAHHGRGRPHFAIEESFDYSDNCAAPVVAAETPRRFARLQKRFGRWGLAWLESLLRSADYAASAGIVASSVQPLRERPPVSAPAAPSRNQPLPIPTATLALNPTNPGHYFACCGLFELATRPRLFPDAVAWFERTDPGFHFHLANTPPLTELIEKITAAEITTAADYISDDAEEPDEVEADDEDAEEEDSENEKEASAPPLFIGTPFDLRLDWWTTASPATSALKIWAGSMKVLDIARSMSYTIAQLLASYQSGERILFEICIAYNPAKIAKNKKKAEAAYLKALDKAKEKQAISLKKAASEKSGEKFEKEKAKIDQKFAEDVQKAMLKRDSADLFKKAKMEPFYFDANRGSNSDARDVGFSTNDLGLETLAAPAAEFLTLVGLQRAVPEPCGKQFYVYHLWHKPIPIALLAAAINGLTDACSQQSYCFGSLFRSNKRTHRAFLPAKPI